jgi:hypothetical protein
MVMSAQHQLWISRGSPFTLARPLARLRDRLRAAGYTVYDIGNEQHLDHQPPEDHTPYSETGWPGTSPYGVGTAIDVMPPPAGRGLPSLQTLGRRLFDDRQAGRAGFIKYLNWGPVSDGAAVQDRWMPGYIRRASSDTGHIHLSCRTDWVTSTAADSYNPLEVDDMGNTWTEPLTQGSAGYAGQQRDTALAFAWQAANNANAGVTKLLAAAEADAVRDAAMMAAITGLATAGGVEAAPIVAAVEAVRDEARVKFAELLTALAAEETRAARAEAEVEELRAKLHEAALAEAAATAPDDGG